MKVHILRGPPQSGKTTALAELVEAAHRQRWRVGGFLARGQWHGGWRTGFVLEPVDGRPPVPLSHVVDQDDVGGVDLVDPIRPRVRRFRFEAAGLEAGERALQRAQDAQLVVLDEVGYLELEGGGWDPPLRPLLDRRDGILVLVVRDKLVDRVVLQYGLTEARQHRVGDLDWPEVMLAAGDPPGRGAVEPAHGWTRCH